MAKWEVSLIRGEEPVGEAQPVTGDEVFGAVDIDEVTDDIQCAIKVYNSLLQRSVVSSLLIADDCEIEEIPEITGLSAECVSQFEELFFRVKDAFLSKIDKIDYIESHITHYLEIGDEYSLNFFLLLRWALSLGKAFVLWKFRLAHVEYGPDKLYATVIREAFFYHKERSMGNSEIQMADYLRSTGMLLGGIKGGGTIKSTNKEESGLGILEQLDIIVVEDAPPELTLDELKDGVFVNNAVSQETT